MGSENTQLERSLLKKNGVELFLTTHNAEVPQTCSAKFEPTLRRIAFQAVSNDDTTTICTVLKVAKYLCQQNESSGIHTLLSAGLSDIISKIYLHIFDNLTTNAEPSEAMLQALQLFTETFTLMVPLMKDKCVWLKSTLYQVLLLLSKCYTCPHINMLVVDATNQVLSVVGKDVVHVVREMVSTNSELTQMCKQFISDISMVGDFVTQTYVVEMIARITTTAHRHARAMTWNQSDKDLATLFSALSYTDLDETTQTYLNAVNRAAAQSLVNSTKYKRVTMGKKVYTSSEHSWIHFCDITRRISLNFPVAGEYEDAFENIEHNMVKGHAIIEDHGDLVMTINTNKPLNEHFDDDIISEAVDEIVVRFEPTPTLTLAFVERWLKKNFEDSPQPNRRFASMPEVGYVSVNSSINNNHMHAHSQNVVAASQPTTGLKESRSMVDAHLVVSGGRRPQGMNQPEWQSSAKSKNATGPSHTHKTTNSFHESAFASVAMPTDTQKISKSISYVGKEPRSQEIVPETQGLNISSEVDTSNNLHLSQLHSNSTKILSQEIGDIEQSTNSVSQISKPIKDTWVHPQAPQPTESFAESGDVEQSNDEQSVKMSEPTSSVSKASVIAVASSESVTSHEPSAKHKKQTNSKHTRSENPPSKLNGNDKESTAEQSSSAESSSHKSAATPIKRYAAGSCVSKKKQTTSRKLRKPRLEVGTEEDQTSTNSKEASSSIAKKVNKQFKDLQDTLNSAEKPEELNPVVILSTQEVEKNLKKFKISKRKSSSDKENVRSSTVVGKAQSKPVNNQASKAKSRKMYSAQDVAKKLFDPELDRLSEEMPEGLRNEPPCPEVAKDILATSSESLPRTKTPSHDQPTPSQSRSKASPANKKPQKPQKQGKRKTLQARAANKQKPKPKAKGARVTFDPYDISMSDRDSGFTARKTPRHRSKKEKLFDNSGISSAASTCSDVSWVREHKKKDHGRQANRAGAKPRTYEPKRKKQTAHSHHDLPAQEKSTTVEVIVNPTAPRSPVSSPEKAREDASVNNSFFQTGPMEFALPADLSRSFQDIIEEEEERQRELEKSLSGSAGKQKTPQKVTPVKLTPQKVLSPLVIHKYVLTPLTKHHKTPPAVPNSLTNPQDDVPTQYTHISPVATPEFMKKLRISQTNPELLETNFGLDTNIDDEPQLDDIAPYIQPLPQTSFVADVPPLGGSSDAAHPTMTDDATFVEPEGPLEKSHSARKRNNRTPKDEEPASSRHHATPRKRKRPSKKSRRSHATTSTDSTSEEEGASASSGRRRSWNRAKKLSFSHLTSLSDSSSSTSQSPDKPSTSYTPPHYGESEFEGEDEINAAINQLVREIGAAYKKKRVMRERPVKDICRSMSRNLTEVKHLWRKATIRREGDFEAFKYKFAKVARRHASSVKKILALEGAAQRCMTSLNHQLNNLLKNSVDTLAGIKDAQCQMAESQRRTDKEFQLAVKQVNERARRDIEKVARDIKW